MAAWCYILRCRDGSYYTGCTTDLDARLAQHRSGLRGGYTSTRLPVELVWAGESQTVYDAIAMERRVKRWSRAKKEALIAGDWEALRIAAMSNEHHPRATLAQPPAPSDACASGSAESDGLAVTVDDEGAVTIPNGLLKRLGWEEGETIVVEDREGGVLLRRPKPGELSRNEP